MGGFQTAAQNPASKEIPRRNTVVLPASLSQPYFYWVKTMWPQVEAHGGLSPRAQLGDNH
jgi:hypothetical protein